MSFNAPSGTSTPGAGPSTQTLDPYRTISSALQRPLAPFLPASGDIPDLASLLGLKEPTIADRLAGKNMLFTDEPISKTPSALVTGKKRNKGDPASKQQARKAAQDAASKRTSLGHVSLRRSKRNGGVARRGEHIDYNSLTPLYHLHTLYLCNLLALPPLPSPIPPASELSSLPIISSADGMTTRLLKADFTGIHLKIVASRNPSLVNLQGIVIEETESTFRMVPTDGRTRVIPKDGTQFLLSFPAYSPPRPPASSSAGADNADIDVEKHLSISPRIQLTLLGTNFCFRSADRAGRKFKLAHGGGGNGWGSEWVQGEWAGILDDKPSKPKSSKGSLPLTGEKGIGAGEKGIGAEGMRKRGKSRRKDLLAGGSRQVVF